jgi:hypothetical protein
MNTQPARYASIVPVGGNLQVTTTNWLGHDVVAYVPKESPLAYRLTTSLNNLNRKQDALVEAMESLAKRLTGSAERVMNGQMANSLGEVQGQGSSVDLLCAQVEWQRDQFGILLEIANQTHGVTV